VHLTSYDQQHACASRRRSCIAQNSSFPRASRRPAWSSAMNSLSERPSRTRDLSRSERLLTQPVWRITTTVLIRPFHASPHLYTNPPHVDNFPLPKSHQPVPCARLCCTCQARVFQTDLSLSQDCAIWHSHVPDRAPRGLALRPGTIAVGGASASRVQATTGGCVIYTDVGQA